MDRQPSCVFQVVRAGGADVSKETPVGAVAGLFLMCGIRLNEVIVQVDPYTDEEWRVRKEEIDRKRSEERAFMEGRRAAQKAWADQHP